MARNIIRVLFDATALPARPAGAGVYTIELARALAIRDDIELLIASPVDLGAGTWVPAPATGGTAVRNAWEQVRMPGLARRLSAHVIHGAHFSVPLISPLPRVATMHDLTFFRIPRRYRWDRRWYYRALARAASRAERVIVPSSAVAADAVRFLGYPADRIRVIPEAPRRLPASPEPHAAKDPYLLCVGTAEPGKRAVDAIRALGAIPAGQRPRLVLAGKEGPLSAPLRREAERLGVARQVEFVGYVDDPTLGSLIAGAQALVFPSLYEGFGLPPLEAMALGTPVIAADAPAMNEVLKGAAIFVPPGDHLAIATEVTRLVSDAKWREELRLRGLACAARYSWSQTAEDTVAVYREVAA